MHGQVWIVFPPIQADFLSFIYGAHQQADPDGEQLDVCQRYTYIARDHQSFVENSIQNID